MPAALAAGQHLVFDLGRTAQAYAILDFEADEGSVLELVHASRYDVAAETPACERLHGRSISRIAMSRAADGSVG